jgi:hypothetical protein
LYIFSTKKKKNIAAWEKGPAYIEITMESTSKEVDEEAKGIDNAEKQWSNGL